MRVAGHQEEKNGVYQMIMSWKDDGKRKRLSRSTELKIKGNKKKAEDLLEQTKIKLKIELEKRELSSKSSSYSGCNEQANSYDPHTLFSDYMLEWFEYHKHNIDESTLPSYEYAIKRIIVPYFQKTKVLLSDLKRKDLQMFYMQQLKRVSPNTVKHYHANIHTALEQAVLIELITGNPSSGIKFSKKVDFHAGFYSELEARQL